MKVRTQARRDAIIETAAQLFKEMGYERSSMNELAKRLGGSKTTLYNYFPSKEALFVAVVRAYATVHLSEAVGELSACSQDNCPIETVLMRFGKKVLLVLSNDSSALAVYRMVVAESGHSDIGMLFYESGPQECFDALSALMTGAMERGELRRGDPYTMALQFMALVSAETGRRLYIRDPQPMSLEQIDHMVERAVSMFLSGATPR